MISFGRIWPLFWVGLFCLTGCISFHLPKAAAPIYYQLDYRPTTPHCRQAFKKALRVWSFTSSSPYKGTQMVVQKPQGQVSYSSAFQWVAAPGILVSQSLLRDLNRSRLFPQVLSANNAGQAPLELSGHVFLFAWERTGAASRAALQVEVSLVDTAKPKRVIFRKEYDLRSQPFVEDSSSAFARAMSMLMAQFSEKFQQDLCHSLSTPQ